MNRATTSEFSTEQGLSFFVTAHPPSRATARGAGCPADGMAVGTCPGWWQRAPPLGARQRRAADRERGVRPVAAPLRPTAPVLRHALCGRRGRGPARRGDGLAVGRPVVRAGEAATGP